jgi:hypothetical protein
MAPRSIARGSPAKRGSGSDGDVKTAQEAVGAFASRYGTASSSGRDCFAPSRCAPERGPRGPAKRGSGSGGDVKTASKYTWGANSPLRGRIFLRKRLLRPSRCAPERGPRGPAKRGSGSGGDARPRQSIHGAPTARYGVASSCGRDCSALRGLFALSHFAHPIPQSPPSRQRRFVQRFPKEPRSPWYLFPGFPTLRFRRSKIATD